MARTAWPSAHGAARDGGRFVASTTLTETFTTGTLTVSGTALTDTGTSSVAGMIAVGGGTAQFAGTITFNAICTR